MGIVAQLYTAEVLRRERERGKDVELYRGFDCRSDNRHGADERDHKGDGLTKGDYILFGIALGIMIVYGVLQLM